MSWQDDLTRVDLVRIDLVKESLLNDQLDASSGAK